VKRNHVCRKLGLASVFPASDKLTFIDFGSAAFVDKMHPKLVSTRHYRAPEIILQIGWDTACDIWSAGCIFVELVTGCLLFPIHEDLEHLAIIERLIGPLPVHVAQKHRFTSDTHLVDSTTLKVKSPQVSKSVCVADMMPKLDNLLVRLTNPSVSDEMNEVITGMNHDVTFIEISIWLC
jgi:dual-specificity kinase